MQNLSAEEARRLHAESRARMEAEARAHAEAAKQNRLRYPEAAQFVDDVRSIFGDAKVKYLGEPRADTLRRVSDAKPLPNGEHADAKGSGYFDIGLARGVEATRPLSG